MLKYPISPITQICDTKEWLLDDDLKLVRADSKVFKDVIDMFSKRLCIYNLKDYVVFYNDKECYPYFSCGYTPFNIHYYDLVTSLDVIEKLLYFQFDEDELQVVNFLRTLYDVIERRVPKLNSILILGPSNCGKSYFVDMICNYLLNVGRMGTLNKYNQFGLADCSGKRIIVWDEPNYESARIEDLKKILGGGEHKVNTKFKNDQAVYRTPVIITTNNHISIITNPSFNDRMRHYIWRPFNFLKDCTKLPNPLCTMEMFKRFKIVDNEYNFIQ